MVKPSTLELINTNYINMINLDIFYNAYTWVDIFKADMSALHYLNIGGMNKHGVTQ